jgi:hypothetical protein
MAYWCGVAFGFGVALFFVGLGVIPVTGDSTLTWLKYGGALIALCGCIGASVYIKRARGASNTTPHGPVSDAWSHPSTQKAPGSAPGALAFLLAVQRCTARKRLQVVTVSGRDRKQKQNLPMVSFAHSKANGTVV